MSNLRILRRRIKSIRNIHDITKAMEMISAVRFRRVDNRFRKSLPYTENLENLMTRMLTRELVQDHALFEERTTDRELLVVISGDRGLCGSFNTNLLKALQGYMKEREGKQIRLFTIGKVGNSFVRKRGWEIFEAIPNEGHKFDLKSSQKIADRLIGAFVSGDVDQVHLLSMKMDRPGLQRPIHEPFLNLQYLFERKEENQSEMDYIFEPDKKSTVGTLIHLFIRQKFFNVLLRTITAEYNARMIAMKMATDNSKELISDLTLERNKVRQAMITSEISEIIGGVNAMN